MRNAIIAATAVLLAVPAAGFAQTMSVPTITAKAQTAHYRLVLQIGPVEHMYTKAEAAAKHPASGEIMASGSMSGMSMNGSMGGMAMDTRHLEVHVHSRATNHVVKTARCGITVINRASGKRTVVPIATMYGIKEGPADWHYGNNVDLPAGTYDVQVVVDGEQATLPVTVPPAKM